MNINPNRGNSHKEKSMNKTIKTTSAAVLVTLGFALAALPPTVSTAAEPAAPALAPAKTTTPTGPHHAGRLSFKTPGGQAVELFIQFRNGRALASHVLEKLDYCLTSTPALVGGFIYFRGSDRLWCCNLRKQP